MADDNPTLLAEITKEDYAAFLALSGNDFPNTYDKWLDLTRKQETYYREQRNVVVFVWVQPDEFAQFCHARGTAHNLHALYTFIKEKRARQKK